VGDDSSTTAVDAPPARPRRPPARRGRGPSIATFFGSLFVLGGFLVGSRRLTDNSLFTHLATGRVTLADGAVPRTDPFSFTANGEPWVVQSWLVSTVYGVVERAFGGTGIRIVGGLLVAAIMALVWRLTAPARSLAMRSLIAGLVLVSGVAFYAPRPLVVGLVLMAAVLVLLTEERDPRWLIPIMWVWANSHGSFPLALVAIGAIAAGRWLDGERSRAPWVPLGWALLGTVLAAINPIGPALLTFPVNLLNKMDLLSNVVEWKSPDFSVGYSRVFLILVVVAVLALVRRPSYRAGVPLVVFTAAALLGLRNIPLAALVLVPGMSVGLAGIGRLEGRERGPVPAVLIAVTAVGALLVASVQLGRPAYDLASYPTDGLAWLDQHGAIGVERRLATEDTTGNVIELVFGDRARVFYDDRFDMYPKAVSDDYLTIHRLKPDWQEALDAQRIERVMWEQSSPLATAIRDSEDWRLEYQDAKAFVACRRGVAEGC
jgi:hypothetical protein